MKIVIIGFSGSGKSTLAKTLSKHYNIPVLHLDSVNFKAGWQIRDKKEFVDIIKEFINENDSWIIDGNYTKYVLERFDLADKLFFLNYNRFFCLKSVIKRYKENIGKTRSDMASGCNEKLDLEFLWWVFFKGRSYKRRKMLARLAKEHKESYVFKTRKELFEFYKKNNILYNK